MSSSSSYRVLSLGVTNGVNTYIRDVYKDSVYHTNPKPPKQSTPVSQPGVVEKKTDRPPRQENTDKPAVVAKSEVQKDQLSRHQPLLDDVYSDDKPTAKYIVPPPEDGYSRKIREVYVSNLDSLNHFYFVDNEFVGTRFPYLQKLAQLAVDGSYDMLPIFKATTFISTVVTGLPTEKRGPFPLTGYEACRAFLDVLRMYDYVRKPVVPKTPVVTEKKLDQELSHVAEWSDFDFDSLIQDRDLFNKKKSQLWRLESLDPSRKHKVTEWIHKHEMYFSSGDSKLRSVKASSRRGAPGYMRVN